MVANFVQISLYVTNMINMMDCVLKCQSMCKQTDSDGSPLGNSLLVLGEELRRRLLLNLLPRPLLILQVQSDLALVHCPSINGTNPEGETNKQTSRGGTCGGADAGGSVELHNMQSPIHNASEYMEELWRCIGDVSEKHRVRYAGSYSDIAVKVFPHSQAKEVYVCLLESDTDGA